MTYILNPYGWSKSLKNEVAPIISIILKKFVALNAHSLHLNWLISKITTKEQMKAFIEGVNSAPEPSRTLHLRSLILENGECPSHGSLTAEERVEIFAACQLNYHDYQPLNHQYYRYAFFAGSLNYMKLLQKLDSEEKLIQFLNGSNPKYSLQGLAGGIEISKNVVLKPNLNADIVSKCFTQCGLKFEFFNSPLKIEEFIKALYNLKD